MLFPLYSAIFLAKINIFTLVVTPRIAFRQRYRYYERFRYLFVFRFFADNLF